MKTINNRTTSYPINDLFLNRFSPRAMSGEILPINDLMTLFEAARWAPSASNNQPWRFLYAIKGTPDFNLFLSFLKPMNQTWCINASVLVILLSKTQLDDGRPNSVGSFDTGSAWENLALQAADMRIIAHAMAGFEIELLQNALALPEKYKAEIMIAIGKSGKMEDLPEQLQAREKPSDRKKLEEIVFEGKEGIAKL